MDDRKKCYNKFKFHISVLLRHKENRKAPGVSRDASERLCAPLADKEFCIRGWKRLGRYWCNRYCFFAIRVTKFLRLAVADFDW